MKDRIHIGALPLEADAKVKIAGHAQVIRAQSAVIFIILRDITGTIQCVIDKSNPLFELAESITTESVLEINGAIATTKVTNSTPAGIEIQVETLKIISLADALPIPVVEKGDVEVTTEKRQDWRFLTLRRERDATIQKVFSALDRGYSEYLLSQGFIGVHTPKIMPTASESRADLFEFDHFGNKAYLAQSPQLYKQMAIAAGLERVFEITPLFRADKSMTNRHSTEFIGHDVEMGYIDDFADVMDMLENTVAAMLDEIHKSCGDAIEKHFGFGDFRLKKPMLRITIHKAREILKSRGVQTDDGGDLTTAEEKAIGEWAKEAHDNDFVFVTEYPWAARPFYHKKGVSSDTGEAISVSADLLYKGVELVTTAQREENYDKLVAQCLDKGLGQEELQWYLDCFRFGMPPHGGWGMGGARFIKQLLDLDSIREVMFLFRGPSRMSP
ncbi:MAG: aspartate--tRNA(Asn) ligase [Alphaproteobacteria bacterium]|nr:aspartate--tRNA(Asn) ligase [Alphaproteobacteria bacterium]MCL2757733.1 aspartate--tRNA(Asn) ligase [Alphaproteobacteria bacterium]